MSVLKHPACALLLWSTFLIALFACTLRYTHPLTAFLPWSTGALSGALLIRRNYLARRQPVITTTTSDETRESVVFILGPWAKTWFSGALENDGIQFVRGKAWFLVSSPAELTRHLHRLESQHPEVIPLSFFPLMPDAHATSALTYSQITMWKNTFASLSLDKPLPCTFALYGQMSAERHAQDPDVAIWSSDFPAADAPQYGFCEALTAALANVACPEGNHHALRRYAIASGLHDWMKDGRLHHALDTLFSTLPLRLNGVLLADYGSGFIRHGAWSSWCEQNYGLLPGLAASLSTPPLPEPPSIYRTTKITRVDPPGLSVGYKGAFAALLICALGLMTVSGEAALRAWQIAQLMNGLSVTGESGVQEKAHLYTALEQKKRQLTSCHVANRLWPHLHHCETLEREIALQLHPESYIIGRAAAGIISPFASSSATLPPGQEKTLASLSLPLRHDDAARIVIVGYSDNTGSEEQNNMLSEARARNVRDWLVNHSGLPAARFTLYGAGARHPLANNESKTERAKNRRVEIFIVK